MSTTTFAFPVCDIQFLAGVTGGKEGDKGFDVNQAVDNGNRWAGAGTAIGTGIGLTVGGLPGAGIGAAVGTSLGWFAGAAADTQAQLGIKPNPEAQRVARFGR